ncbi:uncharacterized protein LOC119555271 [Drosophila subpulchrella]|uniref:uncharacterized protein LOC119555271 n=1 Tax=Drosophila subpulchrella TaxID=1486046 RepID=UPI0018A15241|nr:uncharacterized protein LOC119555271 [Drosophila subpulchrella]
MLEQAILPKLFLVAFAVIAAVAADVSHLPSNEYLPPVQEQQIIAGPSNEYLPPVAQEVEAAPAHELADDGYRYKTHRRVVLRRHRRDVNELPSNEYLPPVAPSNEYLAPVEAAPETILADDGYRYKTHKRVVLRRHRRDVNELSNEYLPPVQEAVAPSNEYLAPVEAPETVLADDGYRYKTHKRVVVRRHRRDVNELSNEYLPPVQAAAPSNEYLPPVQVEAAPETVLADDGYRYKTHKRVVLRRHRRDVNELPSNEYLPPVAPSNEYLAPVEAAPETILADDGYRYKTNKRVVLRRHRRDVSHLPSNEYLPPVQAAAPSNEYLPPVSAPLADDGYRYKTHRRVVYRRHRRDVSELPSNEYLPPVAPSNEYLAPVEAAPETILADDGYRYKTHKRVVVRRHRRDVNELSNEYLPPVQEAVAPSNEYLAPVEAPETVLADDGYRYKTHRRVVVRRHRRDVNELSNEYLPPVQEAVAPSNEYLAPVENTVEVAPAHVLADDGYRYKTHKRVVIRRH